MSRTKSFDVVFERPLMLEIGTTDAKPALAAVLLVGSPVTFDGQQLPTLAAREGLDTVLPFVVSLKRSEVLERLGSRVLYVVLASLCAAIARNPCHHSWLRSLQRLSPSPILRSMSPHVHLFSISVQQSWVHDI